MLKAEGLRKSYGSLKVLKGVTLRVEKGEVVVIVGASGAGKSTLLHILGTLDSPESGSVLIQDKDVFTQSQTALAQFRNKHIGFVFQFHNLLPEFSAVENVMIPGLIAGGDEKQVRKKAEELMMELGIAGRRDHKPSEMSGGRHRLRRRTQRQPRLRQRRRTPSIIFQTQAGYGVHVCDRYP